MPHALLNASATPMPSPAPSPDGGAESVLDSSPAPTAETNVLAQFYGVGVDCGSLPAHQYTNGDVLIDDRAADHEAYIANFAMGGGDDNNPSLHGFQTGNNFAVVLSGTVPITVAGSYTFTLTL